MTSTLQALQEKFSYLNEDQARQILCLHFLTAWHSSEGHIDIANNDDKSRRDEIQKELNNNVLEMSEFQFRAYLQVVASCLKPGEGQEIFGNLIGITDDAKTTSA